MHVFELVQAVFAAEGVDVTALYADTAVVTAEARLEFLDIVSSALGGLDFNRPEKELVARIRGAIKKRLVVSSAIFAGTLSTRGSKKESSPFLEFLRECRFVTPFKFAVDGVEKPAYRTSNYQFVMTYDHPITVGNIGKVVIAEFNTKTKIDGLSLRKIRGLLSEYAENVPNERGVTGSQRRTGYATPSSKLASTSETDVCIPDNIKGPVDLSSVSGRKFSSFQELGACLR